MCPIKENGLRSTCLSERVDLSKIGTVESSNIGCAIKFSGSLLILFLKMFNSFLVALDPISIPYPPDPWTSFTTNFSKLFITYLLSFLS